MQALEILNGVLNGRTPLLLMVKVNLSRTCDQRDAPSALLPEKNRGSHPREEWFGPRAGSARVWRYNISDQDSNSSRSSS